MPTDVLPSSPENSGIYFCIQINFYHSEIIGYILYSSFSPHVFKFFTGNCVTKFIVDLRFEIKKLNPDKVFSWERLFIGGGQYIKHCRILVK